MGGRPRRGFTLLEIVLGMAIFFGALAIFSQILWNGSRAAVQGQLRSQALVRCEAKLGEVVAGATPFQSQQNQAFSSDTIDDGWNWSVEIEPTDFPNLNAVVVTVDHTGNSDLANVSVQLRRWMRDPAQMALVAEEAALQEQENKERAEEAKTLAEEQKKEAEKSAGQGGINNPQGKTRRGDNQGKGNPKGPGNGNPKGNPNGPGDGIPKGNPKGPNGTPKGLPPNLPPGFPPNFPPEWIPLIPPEFLPKGTPKGR